MTINTFLLTEKYRPSKVEDCVLPNRIKDNVTEFIAKGQIPHMLFSGTAGQGKTTLAQAISNELNADLMFINASKENGIDIIRNKITQFASTVSFDGNLKIVLLDEADRLSAAAQDSLKATMEEFHDSTRFILTCNTKNKIIDPIQSRCVAFDFAQTADEKKTLQIKALKRVVQILAKEKIESNIESVASLVQKYYPDMRKILNEVQRYSVTGKIDAGILVQQDTTIDELVEYLRNKKFNDVRKWVARNPDLDPSVLFRYFFDNLSVLFDPSCIPNIILILAQYQRWAVDVVDQEINLMACFVELVGTAKWK